MPWLFTAWLRNSSQRIQLGRLELPFGRSIDKGVPLLQTPPFAFLFQAIRANVIALHIMQYMNPVRGPLSVKYSESGFILIDYGQACRYAAQRLRHQISYPSSRVV